VIVSNILTVIFSRSLYLQRSSRPLILIKQFLNYHQIRIISGILLLHHTIRLFVVCLKKFIRTWLLVYLNLWKVKFIQGIHLDFHRIGTVLLRHTSSNSTFSYSKIQTFILIFLIWCRFRLKRLKFWLRKIICINSVVAFTELTFSKVYLFFVIGVLHDILNRGVKQIIFTIGSVHVCICIKIGTRLKKLYFYF